ncbi:MAG TPA: hypothetical protein VF483_05780 [Gemmatimonadaceae bacterium]
MRLHAILAILAAGVLLSQLACDARHSPGSARDSLLQAYSAAERAKPSPTRPLGGVNVWEYCRSLGYPTVGYKKGFIQGKQAAYDNWVCQRGTNQLKPVDPRLIDVAEACRFQYKVPDAIARPDDADHAWSWNCYPATAR